MRIIKKNEMLQIFIYLFKKLSNRHGKFPKFYLHEVTYFLGKAHISRVLPTYLGKIVLIFHNSVMNNAKN